MTTAAQAPVSALGRMFRHAAVNALGFMLTLHFSV